MLIDFVRIILSCGACFEVCSFCFCDGSIRFLLITFKTWTYQKRKNIYEIHLFQLDWCFCFSLLITRKIHWSLVCLWLVKNVILHLYIYVRYDWYILNVWKYCCALTVLWTGPDFHWQIMLWIQCMFSLCFAKLLWSEFLSQWYIMSYSA